MLSHFSLIFSDGAFVDAHLFGFCASHHVDALKARQTVADVLLPLFAIEFVCFLFHVIAVNKMII
jgi:hypothetical protein